MKISAILAVYNGAATVKGTLESILAQSHDDFEVLVINDGSTDKSEEIIKSFNDERIKYFSQKNSGGPAGPRNKGVAEAEGELVALCDQDDLWEPDKLKKQVAAYEAVENANVGIVCSWAKIVNEKGQKIAENKTEGFTGFVNQKEAFKKLLATDFITACTALIPKKVLMEVGGFDESLRGNDEYDLWLRITQKYGVLVVPEFLATWQRAEGALSWNLYKIYGENEKIFDRLDALKLPEVAFGHGKNLARVFTRSLMAKKFDLAENYAQKIQNYPRSNKINFVLSLHHVNKWLGYCFLKLLDLFGLIK